MRIRGMLVTLLAAACLGGCGTQRALDVPPGPWAAASPECNSEVQPIDEPTQFIAYEDRRTQNPDTGSMAVKAPSDSALGQRPFAREIDGLAAQGMVDAEGSLDVYYASEPVEGMSYTKFLQSGGIALRAEPGEKGDVTAVEEDRRLFEGRYVDVTVGPYQGLLRWMDPNQDGVRPHLVLWTEEDGQTYYLTGLREPEELLTLARSLVC